VRLRNIDREHDLCRIILLVLLGILGKRRSNAMALFSWFSWHLLFRIDWPSSNLAERHSLVCSITSCYHSTTTHICSLSADVTVVADGIDMGRRHLQAHRKSPILDLGGSRSEGITRESLPAAPCRFFRATRKVEEGGQLQ
jgi:hypothetical protein